MTNRVKSKILAQENYPGSQVPQCCQKNPYQIQIVSIRIKEGDVKTAMKRLEDSVPCVLMLDKGTKL